MEIEESYQLYKTILKEILKKTYLDDLSEINSHLSESPTSYLMFIKHGITDFKEKHPNALNEIIEVPKREIPYINRIAGFINIDNGETEIIDSLSIHKNIQEHYKNNMARFMLFDGIYGRSVYISINDEEKLEKAYRLLKKAFKDDWVDTYILDLSNGDTYDTFIKTYVYDRKGKKYDANIFNQGKDVPWLRKYMNERFNLKSSEINKILELAGVKNNG